MKKLYKIIILTVIGMALLFVVDLWFDVISDQVMVKIFLTVGVFLAVIWAVAAIKDEFVFEKKLKDDDYLG